MLFHAVPRQREDSKRSPTSKKLIVVLMLSSCCLWTLSTTIVLGKVLTKSSTKQQLHATGELHEHSTLLLSNDIDLAEISSNLIKDDLFCNSIKGARTNGKTNRTMIQTFVSNSGHLPFLQNALLSMRESKLPWKPLVLAIGTDLCPMITNLTLHHIMDNVICVPYLDRLLNQLQRDEPQSFEQIQTALKEHNATSQSLFHHIEKSVFGWGSGAEYKFLINAKLYALRDVIKCGSDAFITDTDIGFRQDPRPYFNVNGEEGDIIGQNDTNSEMYKLNLNSGFMYWKATERNIELIDDIIKVPPFYMNDQMRVNNRMNFHGTPHTILDVYKFPNGWMLRNHFKELTDIVIFHANWDSNQSRKRQMLKRAGLWFLNETTM